MKVDEVITVPADVHAIHDALFEMADPSEKLCEKYNLQPPVSTRILDGHGNLIVTIQANWDKDGNRLPTAKPEETPELWTRPMEPGMFWVLEDSQGKTATIKLQIEGQPEPN